MSLLNFHISREFLNRKDLVILKTIIHTFAKQQCRAGSSRLKHLDSLLHYLCCSISLPSIKFIYLPVQLFLRTNDITESLNIYLKWYRYWITFGHPESRMRQFSLVNVLNISIFLSSKIDNWHFRISLELTIMKMTEC